MWRTPTFKEVAVGLEINCYACAEIQRMASKNLMGGSLKELKEVKDKLQDLGLSIKSMKSEGDILKALAKWKTTFGKGKMEKITTYTSKK